MHYVYGVYSLYSKIFIFILTACYNCNEISLRALLREVGSSYGRAVPRAAVEPTSGRAVRAIVLMFGVERLTLLVALFIEILFFYTMDFIFFLGYCSENSDRHDDRLFLI